MVDAARGQIAMARSPETPSARMSVPFMSRCRQRQAIWRDESCRRQVAVGPLQGPAPDFLASSTADRQARVVSNRVQQAHATRDARTSDVCTDAFTHRSTCVCFPTSRILVSTHEAVRIYSLSPSPASCRSIFLRHVLLLRLLLATMGMAAPTPPATPTCTLCEPRHVPTITYRTRYDAAGRQRKHSQGTNSA